jgi:AMMECR1 domain-containing protein
MPRVPLLAACAIVLASGPAAARPPEPPDIAPEKGEALIRLTRSAMMEYLRRRTPAERQPIPAELSSLGSGWHAATVTLHGEGGVKGRVVIGGGNPARNVVAAAVKAMRSGELPDRVTPAVLDGLIVEVELIAALEEVAAGDVAEAAVPGLTGLLAAHDRKRVYVLPSMAYWDNLDAGGMRRLALGLLGSPAKGWAVFATRRFVGVGGAAYAVPREKLPSPGEAPSAEELAAACGRAAGALLSTQGASGRYGGGLGPAPGQEDPRAGLRGHLLAALAMARLAAAAPRPEYARSAWSAIEFAAAHARGRGDSTYLNAPRPEDQLAAASLLLAAVAEAPQEPQAAATRPAEAPAGRPPAWPDLRGRLRNALLAAAAKDPLPARLDAEAGPPATPADALLARYALTADGATAAELKALPPPPERTPRGIWPILWKRGAGLTLTREEEVAGAVARLHEYRLIRLLDGVKAPTSAGGQAGSPLVALPAAECALAVELLRPRGAGDVRP